MTRLQGEYVYTAAGRQRPVFLSPLCVMAKFSVLCGDHDAVRVEISNDPLQTLKHARARWENYHGGLGGGVYGVTGIRLVVERVDGWVSLILEQQLDSGE